MRQVTRTTVAAFLESRTATVGNTRTDGFALYLHGNKIAERREDGDIWVTLAGWPTVTTRDRLNGIPGVRVSQRGGRQYLNGHPWCGGWVRIPNPNH